MARLEELTNGAMARGVLSDRAVKVVAVEWHGSNAITLTFTDEATGKPGQELRYRDDEPRLTVDEAGRAWSMDADGAGRPPTRALTTAHTAVLPRRRRSSGPARPLVHRAAAQ